MSFCVWAARCLGGRRESKAGPASLSDSTRSCQQQQALIAQIPSGTNHVGACLQAIGLRSLQYRLQASSHIGHSELGFFGFYLRLTCIHSPRKPQQPQWHKPMWELARKRLGFDHCCIACRQAPTENIAGWDSLVLSEADLHP